MTALRFTISLRIRHPVHAHQLIVDSIGMEPEFANSVGTLRMTPKGQLLGGAYKETYCCFELIKSDDGWFTDGIDKVLPLLANHREFLASISDTGGCSELYVGVFADGDTTGFTMEVEMMAALADLRVQLSVEFYCG